MSEFGLLERSAVTAENVDSFEAFIYPDGFGVSEWWMVLFLRRSEDIMKNHRRGRKRTGSFWMRPESFKS